MHVESILDLVTSDETMAPIYNVLGSCYESHAKKRMQIQIEESRVSKDPLNGNSFPANNSPTGLG